jgi:hypothetical protein
MNINLNINALPGGVELVQILRHLLDKVNHMTNILEQLTQDVAEVKSVNASAVALLNGLHAKLIAALQGGDWEAVQALSDSLATETHTLADAVAANTIADPAPVE